MLAEGRLCGKGGSYLIEWRKLVCGVLIAVVPASLMAQTSDRELRGLLHSDGGTWLNGSPAPPISAIFPDSLVQVQSGHSARINVEGSTVLIAPETIVQFQGNELALDHGSLQLDTAREMKVLIGCVTVAPLTSDETQYNVTDVDGRVKVVALKNDVKIHLHGAVRNSKQGASSDLIVREGEQATRRDRCGALIQPTQGTTDGAVLDSPWFWGTGVAAVAVITCLGLLCCPSDDPVSPSKP
jgi:hypothetical protein